VPKVKWAFKLPSSFCKLITYIHIQPHRTAKLDVVIAVTPLVILHPYVLHVCCADPAVNTNLRPSSSLAQPNGPVRHLSPCEAGLGITYWDQHYSPSWQGLCAVDSEDIEKWMETEVLHAWHIKQSGLTFVQHSTNQSCLLLILWQMVPAVILYSLQTSMLNPSIILEWFHSVRSSHMTLAQCSGRTTSFGKPPHFFSGLRIESIQFWRGACQPWSVCIICVPGDICVPQF
jgi:hypothetical protein